MIRKAQKNFIVLTVSILFFVFSCIFGISCILMNSANTKMILSFLNDLEFSYVNDNLADPPKNGFIIEFVEDIDSESTSYTIKKGERTFNNFSIKEFLEVIQTRENINVGVVKNIHYKILIVDEHPVILGIDGTFIKLDFNTTIINLLLTLLVIFLILCAVVVVCSYKFFRPIKDAFEKQKQFISDAGHELKTPITVINANAELLTSEDNSKWVANIKSQTERMNLLVQDLLTLTKTEEQTENIREDINLSELTLDNILPFEALAFEQEKLIISNITEGIHIHSNRKSVQQIINILLDNAVKHSNPNSEIIVELKKDGNKAVLTITNQGSLVKEGQEAKMFERFYRADDSRSRDSGGSGLGLSIAKSLANKNKWKIYANSVYKKSMKISIVF